MFKESGQQGSYIGDNIWTKTRRWEQREQGPEIKSCDFLKNSVSDTVRKSAKILRKAKLRGSGVTGVEKNGVWGGGHDVREATVAESAWCREVLEDLESKNNIMSTHHCKDAAVTWVGASKWISMNNYVSVYLECIRYRNYQKIRLCN